MLVRASPVQVPATDAERVHEAWRRRMLVDGTWKMLLAEHGQRQLGPLRARLVGEWDTSANLFSNVVDQTSTMYDEEPQQQSTDKVSLAVLQESFERGCWWEMARDNQRYTKGLNENLVYVGWDPEMGHTTFELCTADLVTMDPSPHNYRRPVTIWRARQRPVPGKSELAWFWDRWSTVEGGSHTVWTSDRRKNVTAGFFDPNTWAGSRYPFRDEAGRPVLPFATYRAVGGGTGLWTCHRRAEVVFGTLQVGLLWTTSVHGVIRAGFDLRVLLNGEVRGGTTGSAGGQEIRSITPDPTAVLQVRGENAKIDAWGSSIDIDASENFCRRYEARLAVHFGLSPADVQIESINPASGASITVSRKGLRVIAKRDLVNFGRGDLRLAEVVAAVNRGYGRPCSARGYRLRYRGIDLDPAEREIVGRYMVAEIEAGLADRATAYQELHPGTDLEDAEADLRAIDMRARQDAVIAELLRPTPPPAPPAPPPAPGVPGET